MRIDLRRGVSLVALLLGLLSFVHVCADPVADGATGDTETAAPSGSDSSAGESGDKSTQDDEDKVPAEPFIPSEKISADSAVSFPVDI